MNNVIFKLILIIFPCVTWAQDIWQRGVQIYEPRENIYQLPPQRFHATVMEGRKQVFFYPVTVTELTLPYRPLVEFFENDEYGPARKLFFEMAKIVSPFKSMDHLLSTLGLHEFPETPQEETPNEFPPLSRAEQEHRMGTTIFHTDKGDALTFSCAACHTSDLFGVKVIGLTNRFPQANSFFVKTQQLIPYINTFVFKGLLQTTEGEREILKNAKKALRYVGTKEPVVLGLDTSLAQVALSLAKREKGPYAERKGLHWRFPRHNKLETMIADSKPAVWWNLKYKNRWLSDGSIVSGNPVHTNFLWNEIGRGADLKKLEQWMIDSQEEIEALTASVFATQPPRYEKFFGEGSIDIAKAKRGEAHFLRSCQQCHGIYEKAWNSSDAHRLTAAELVQTTRVRYHEDTPVKDVGTDPGRWRGMWEFADDLNRLAISKTMKTVVEPQKGYVPPPLVGIWARWPYLHNNSIPNLCVLLTKASERPQSYWMGPANDKERDFDQECVGYPMGAKTPASWKKEKDFYYDNRKEGLSNSGHDRMFLTEDGREIYTKAQKLELIEFLKTL